MPLRIIFCGTPAFALPALKHLIAQPDFKVESVVTQPDRPKGRGQATFSSPVKDAAIAAAIPVTQPEKVKSEDFQNYLNEVAPDVVVIIAYGQIIPARLIEIPRLGWINLHGSLLPKYRGAAPVNWAIANGERTTGLTTMQINAGLDTGPTLLKYETAIGPDETAPELTVRLAAAGAPLMSETLRKLASGEIAPTLQDDSQATFAPPMKKEDGRVNWSLPAGMIYNRIRAFQPWPGAFASFRGKACRVWGTPYSGEVVHTHSPLPSGTTLFQKGGEILVACGENTALHLEFVQLEGRKRITAREFVNGARMEPGERLSS